MLNSRQIEVFYTIYKEGPHTGGSQTQRISTIDQQLAPVC